MIVIDVCVCVYDTLHTQGRRLCARLGASAVFVGTGLVFSAVGLGCLTPTCVRFARGCRFDVAKANGWKGF